jgi:hypothetical protein
VEDLPKAPVPYDKDFLFAMAMGQIIATLVNGEFTKSVETKTETVIE